MYELFWLLYSVGFIFWTTPNVQRIMLSHGSKMGHQIVKSTFNPLSYFLSLVLWFSKIHPVLFREYYWLCEQRSFLAVLKRQYDIPEVLWKILLCEKWEHRLLFYLFGPSLVFLIKITLYNTDEETCLEVDDLSSNVWVSFLLWESSFLIIFTLDTSLINS